MNYLCNINEMSGDFFVKVRSTGNLLPCKVHKKGLEVHLVRGEAGISPGQACVFYKEDDIGFRIFGGGWIDKTE